MFNIIIEPNEILFSILMTSELKIKNQITKLKDFLDKKIIFLKENLSFITDIKYSQAILKIFEYPSFLEKNNLYNTEKNFNYFFNIDNYNSNLYKTITEFVDKQFNSYLLILKIQPTQNIINNITKKDNAFIDQCEYEEEKLKSKTKKLIKDINEDSTDILFSIIPNKYKKIVESIFHSTID